MCVAEQADAICFVERITPMQALRAVTIAAAYQHFEDEIKGGNIPSEFIPACDKGSRSAMEQGRMIGFHLPDGGLGRVERDGTSYRFVAG